MTAAVDILSISEVSYVDQVFGYLGMRLAAKSLSDGKHPEILSAAAPRPPVTHHFLLSHLPRGRSPDLAWPGRYRAARPTPDPTKPD
ncbi:MAG: hypothetical protein OXH85_01835 [Truepera sp.]|nr:hypothetical protein [Truepera sp.]